MRKLITSILAFFMGIMLSFAQSSGAADYAFDFSTAENFAKWTVIDGNPSATPSVWTYDSNLKNAVMSSNAEAADDWIISPAVTLEAGKSYDITAKVMTDMRWDTQKFTITAGSANTIEAQTTQVLSVTDLKDISLVDKTGSFVPATTGTYYIGIHCTSGRYNGELSFNKLTISKSPEIPNPVTDISLTAEGNTLVLNFTPPTSGPGGSKIDTDNLSYKIERSTGGVKATVEEAYKGTLPYREEITELNVYQYAVTVISKDGSTSTTVESEKVTAGPAYTVPYEVTFDNADKASLFTIINANNDSRTWSYSSYDKGFDYWGGSTADDWIVSPKVALEAGKAYKVTFKAKLSRASESDYKNMAIALSDDGKTFADAAGTFVVNSTFVNEYSAIISVAESCEKNIGLHVFGTANSNDIYVKSLAVVEEVIKPAAIADLVANAGENGAMKAVLTWTNPSTSNAGSAIDALTKYEIYRSSELISTKDNPAPGATETFTDEAIAAAGKQEYSVKVYIGENFTETAVTSAWIGEDTPKTVNDLTVTNEGSNVSVAFNPPTETVNGGWLNLVGMTYKIERNAEVIQEKYAGELPYVDEVPALGSYKYKVTPITATGLVGTAVESNSIVAGPAYKVPFEVTINSAENGNLFSVVDANNDGKTWKYYSDTKGFDYWGGTTADDWLVSPKITLEAGKTYKVTFKAWLSSGGSSNYKNIAVAVSKDGTTFGEAAQSFEIQSTFANEFSTNFTVPETGDWNVGLHVHGQTNYNDVYINYLSVKTDGAKPAEIADFAAVAAEGGKMEAILSWTNPSTTTTGDSIKELTKYEILLGDSIVATAENLVAGKKETFTDAKVASTGLHEYTLRVYLGSFFTEAKAKTNWVGEDTPLAVPNIELSSENDSVKIVISRPTGTVNGGWLNLSGMTYKIERNGEVIQEAATDTVVIDKVPSLGNYKYKVTPVTASGLIGASAESQSIVAGPAMEVPYEETINTKDKAALFTAVDTNNDGRTWGYTSYPTEGFSYWGGDEANDWLLTPKIHLLAGKAYKVTIKAKLERAMETDYKNIRFGVTSDGKEFSLSADSVTVQSTFVESFSSIVSVSEEGNWYVGVNVIGQTSMNGVIITYISVEETTLAPIAPANVTATAAENGELKATVKWANPTVTNAGTTISALTKYEVLKGTEILTTVENPVPGADESFIDDKIAEAGTQEYTVKVYIGESSAEAKATSNWIGEDTPLAVTELTATAKADSISVSFTAPAGTVHDGWLNVEALGYKIERNAEVIEEMYTGQLPYVDKVPGLNSYVYTVTPVTSTGLAGESATSADVIAGNSIEIPYEFDFASQNLFKLYTIVDADENNKTWEYDTYENAPAIGFEGAADDWVFTPKFNLSNGYVYTVTITASLDRALSEAYYKTLEFTLGEGVNPANHSLVLATKRFESALSEDFTFSFTPKESGELNLGIHCTGTINWTNLYIRNIKITGEETSGINDVLMGNDDLFYNKMSNEVIADSESVVFITSINGAKVAEGVGSVSVANLPEGLYIATAIKENGEKTNIKFIKQ